MPAETDAIFSEVYLLDGEFARIGTVAGPKATAAHHTQRATVCKIIRKENIVSVTLTCHEKDYQ